MFSLNKRLMAVLLIIAMITTNVGTSTLAVSISHYVEKVNQNEEDESDISHRYYDEWRYSLESKTYLMNDEGESSPVQGEDGGSHSSPEESQESTDISETNASDFDVESENSEIEENTEAVEDSTEAEEDSAEAAEGIVETADDGTEGAEDDKESEEDGNEGVEDDKESVGASTASPDESDPKVASASEANEEEDTESLSAQTEDEPEDESEPNVATASDLNEVEEETLVAQSEDETEVATASIASEDAIPEIASDSEVDELMDIASDSEAEPLMKLGLFGADPHEHKICGATAGGTCLHTMGAVHDASFDYTYLPFFDGATMTEDEIKNKLQTAADKYYLDQDINFSTLTNVVLSGVLVLCLNGKNINNAYFSGADIIITNCTNTVSKMTNPSDEHRLFNGNTYVYGMNKNINLNSDMVIETITNGVALFYDVLITSPDNTRTINSKSAIAPTNGLNLILEKVTARNLARMYTFFNLNSKDNVTVAVKNSTFDGLKNELSTFLFMNDSHQGSTLNFYGDNLFTNCEVGFAEYEATNRIEAIITVRRSDMFIHDGTTTIENNISRGRSVLLESVHDTANIEIKDGANLVINNNQIHMQNVTTCAMYINNRFRLYGNLSITNNKIINCGTNNSVDISGFYYLHTGQAIPVGNSKIIVSGNTSDGDEKTYPRQHVFQVLAHRTAGLFSQEAGTELDIDSRMTIAFTSGAAGTIMSDWSHSDDKAFDTIFKADKFTDDEFLIVKDQNKAVQVMSHGHKICGYSSIEECDHRGIATHSDIISYSKFFGNSTMTDADIESKLNAGGSYRLDKDINLTSLTQIRLTADLYLCLNGKSMHNVTFGSGTNNNFKIYITNCKNEDSIVTRGGDSAEFIINYSNVSVIAPYKNITLDQATRFLYSVTTTTSKFDLYGLNFICSAAWPLTNSLIRSDSAGSEVNVSNVNISNFDAGGNFGHIQMVGTGANKSSLNIYESKLEGNTHTGNYENRKSLIYADHCDTNIYDSDIINNKVGMAFYNGGSGTSNFQNVNITGNETHCWVMNMNGTTNTFDNVNVSNNTWGVKYGGAVVDVKENAVLNVKASGLKINNNTEVLETPTVLYVATGGVLNVEEGATLEIKENKLKYYTSPDHDIFSIMPGAMHRTTGYQYTLNILGNLYVENNKIVNAQTPATKQFAAVYLSYEKKMNVGNGIISVQNNFIYSDAEGNVRADDTASEYYHMYQMYTNNANGLFTQEPGTEMSTDSKIELGFYSSPYMGMFFENWAHSDKNAFKTIFTADKYRDDEFSVVKDENNKLRIMAHGHKICGHMSDEECDHRGIATHSEVFSYAAFFGSTTMTDTQKVNKLSAGGSYRLDADLELSGPTNVNLSADLYLCLNGKTLNNVVFDSSGINNHKVYITNCKKETATIRRETGAAWFITNYKDASVMAPHKNINLINSNRMRNETTTANKLDLYGVTFSQDPKGDIEHSLIRTVAAGSEINISNVNLSNFIANVNNFAYIQVGGSGTNKSTLNIYDSVFSDNEYKGSYNTAKNIINVNNCNTSIYDTLFKNNSCSIVFANNNSGSSILQNVEFIDNTTFAQVVKLHGTTNDFDNVNVSNNKRAVSQNASAVDVMNNAVLNVKAGGLKVNKNTQVIGAVDCIWLGNDGVLNVEEGATLEIKENILTHTSISTAVPAYSMILGNDSGSERWEINILGNLYVENNKLVNAPNPMNVVFAGLYIKDGKRITTGNGVVKVQNNGVYTDADGKVKADEKVLADYHPYQVLADNVNGFLAQAAGTEISIDSRMEVAFINSPYIGIIYDSWTHSNKNAYETIFTADRFRDEDLKVVKDENNKIRIMTHGHKICGAKAGDNCLHTLVASHSEIYDYFAVFGGKTLTDAEILAKLNTPGKYKLDGNINLANPTEIDLGADIYICLNGFNITNVRFKSTGGHTAYITNCKTQKSTIDTNSDQVLTTASTEIYGINKNITFKTAAIYSGASATSRFYTYGVEFTQNSQSFNESIIRSSANKTIICEDTIFNNYTLADTSGVDSKFFSMSDNTSAANAITNFKNVTISNIKQLNSRIITISPSAKMQWYGDNVIENNTYQTGRGSTNFSAIFVSGLFKVCDGTLTIQKNESLAVSRNFFILENGGNIEVDEDATLIIQQNKKKFLSGYANTFINIQDNGTKIHGTLKIINNSITDASSNTENYISGIHVNNGRTLEVGKNPIIIQGNTCDGNVATSPYQHFYQVVSLNTSGFLTLKTGTEMSKDSRMQVQFGNSPFTGTIMNNWDHSDSAAYDTIFSADRTRATELTVNLNMNKQVEIVNGGHLHKPCGVEKVTYCSHRGIDDHNYGVPYLPFSNGIDMTNDTEIRNKLAAGGYYYADQNIAASAIQEVTLAADLYICLNGKNMANISFGNSQYKVFITNCSRSEVSITVVSSNEFLKTVSANLVAGRGRINVIADGFYYANRNSTITINSTFYNICSSPGSTAASEQQLFSMQNYTSRGHSIVVSNCEFKNHRKQYGSGVRPNMLFMRTKGRIYDTTFKNLTTGNSAFLTYEDSDILYDNCTFDTISTGGTESGVGSLFRSDMWSLEGAGEDIPSTLTLENITILNSEMNRSFVEVNPGSRLTININNSFVAKNNDVNRTGGNNFFNTKTLRLINAKLDLDNNVSNNDGLPGLVSAQNSIELRNSYINISNNTIKRNASGQQSLLKLDAGDILVASNSYIVIKNNKINTDGISGNNSILSALYLQAGQTIAIEDGTSYIDISGNEPIGNQKDHVNNHMYQLYMTTADLFKIQNNGLLDMSKSYAEFALPDGTPTGTLFTDWNAKKVKNWNADAHKGRFTASNFGNARKNLVVAHYKHELIVTEKNKFIDSDRAYIDDKGEPLVATVPEAQKRDADGIPFIWWFPTEMRDAYGNVVSLSSDEQYRPVRELTKWTSIADDKTRTAWSFKPIYATNYTIRLNSNMYGTTRDGKSEVIYTVRRGDPVSIYNEFRKPNSITFKFLNYNTSSDDRGRRFTVGYYSQGLVADDRTGITLYVIYRDSSSGGGGSSGGRGGGGGGGGELQSKAGENYQYVTAIYETHSHIADVTALDVNWMKYANTYVAYAIYQYDAAGVPISYAQLKDGFYLIRQSNNVNHVYGFDKQGNMLTGYVEAGGHRYVMAPDGKYEGAMLKSTANVFGNSYMFTDDGIMNDSNTYSSKQFVYDMEIGRYKYINNLPDGRTPNYVKNELKDINYRGKTSKYLFNIDGFMMTGLTGYQNNIYYFNEYGPYIGSAFTGVAYAGGGQATFDNEGHLLNVTNE